MTHNKKTVRYPENIYLKDEVENSGLSVTELAEKIGYNRWTVSRTINGHYLGKKIVPLIKTELGIALTLKK